jgi:glucokinase
MERKHAIGIDLGGTTLRGAVVDAEGRMSGGVQLLTPVKGGPEAIIDALVGMVKTLSEAVSGGINAVGIGMPGPLNAKSGIVTLMPNIAGFDFFPFQKRMESRLAIPVGIINDADAAAVGEYYCGAARGCSLFVMLTLGTGLGSSIMVNGRPWLGRDGYSAELGHVPLFGSADRCGCGGCGHSESRVSIRGLWKDYQQHTTGGRMWKTESEFNVKELFESARNGDTIAAGVVNRYGEALGRVISAAAVTLNLRRCIIGGGIGAAWDILEQPVRQSIGRFGFAPMTDDLVLQPGLLGEDAAVAGAGLMMAAGIYLDLVRTTGGKND